MRTTGGRQQLPWLQEPKFCREDRAGWVMFNTSNWLAERPEQSSATPGPCGGILGPQQYPPRRIWCSSVQPAGRFDSKSMKRPLNSVFTDEGTLGPREGQQLALGHTAPISQHPPKEVPMLASLHWKSLNRVSCCCLVSKLSPTLRLHRL